MDVSRLPIATVVHRYDIGLLLPLNTTLDALLVPMVLWPLFGRLDNGLPEGLLRRADGSVMNYFAAAGEDQRRRLVPSGQMANALQPLVSSIEIPSAIDVLSEGKVVVDGEEPGFSTSPAIWGVPFSPVEQHSLLRGPRIGAGVASDLSPVRPCPRSRNSCCETSPRSSPARRSRCRTVRWVELPAERRRELLTSGKTMLTLAGSSVELRSVGTASQQSAILTAPAPPGCDDVERCGGAATAGTGDTDTEWAASHCVSARDLFIPVRNENPRLQSRGRYTTR